MSFFGKGGGGGNDLASMLLLQSMGQQKQEIYNQQLIAEDKQRGIIQQDMSAASTQLLRDFGRRSAMAGSQAIATPTLA